MAANCSWRSVRTAVSFIESGVADLDDPALNDRIAELKTIRDQAQAGAQRAQAATQGQQEVITPANPHAFVEAARRRLCGQQGSYRRDQLRALAPVTSKFHSTELRHPHAPVVELVDAPDSKSGTERCVGSSPTGGTNR